MVVTFDQWAAPSTMFRDCVQPRPTPFDPDLVDGKALLGLRVSVIVASPFTQNANPSKPLINSGLRSQSIFKHIEWRWGLPPLTAREACSDVQSLKFALNLTSPPA